jgi:hypothetical protein
MILERKFENELKHVQDELNEITSKLRIDVAKKLAGNLGRVVEKQKSDFLKNEGVLASVENFKSFYQFMGLISAGLKLHLQVNL